MLKHGGSSGSRRSGVRMVHPAEDPPVAMVSLVVIVNVASKSTCTLIEIVVKLTHSVSYVLQIKRKHNELHIIKRLL